MQATEAAFILICMGILVAHLATLRFLHRCKELMPGVVDGSLSAGLHPITESLAALCGEHAGVSEGIAEVCRIGADLADALESMPVGGMPVASAGPSGPPDVQATIMQLMLDRFLGGLDGNQTEQERPIQQVQATQNHDHTEDDSEPPAL